MPSHESGITYTRSCLGSCACAGRRRTQRESLEIEDRGLMDSASAGATQRWRRGRRVNEHPNEAVQQSWRARCRQPAETDPSHISNAVDICLLYTSDAAD